MAIDFSDFAGFMFGLNDPSEHLNKDPEPAVGAQKQDGFIPQLKGVRPAAMPSGTLPSDMIPRAQMPQPSAAAPVPTPGLGAMVSPAMGTQLPQGGTVNGQMPDMKFFDTPSGGQAGVPQAGIRGTGFGNIPITRSPEDIQRGVEETRYQRRLSGITPQEAGRATRLTEQQRARDESSKSMIKSLEEQGMDKDAIKKAIGFNEGMTRSEGYYKLRALTKSRQGDAELPAYKARQLDNARENANWKDGQPANSEARYIDIRDELSMPAYPGGDTLRSFLTPEQDKAFENLLGRIGKAQDRDFERIAKQIRVAKTKAQNKFKKDVIDKTMKAAQQKEKSEADAKWLKDKTTEFDKVTKALDAGDFSEEDEKTLGERQIKILNDINKFNETGATGGKPTLMNRDAFINDFKAEEGRDPTSEEVEALRGRAWN